MSDRTVTRKVLTGTEMDKIKAAAHVSWVSAVVETFLCFGVDVTDRDAPRLRPGDFEIPEDQWGEIATACSDSPVQLPDGPVRASEVGRVNHMLDWMNYGPSSFKR